MSLIIGPWIDTAADCAPLAPKHASAFGRCTLAAMAEERTQPPIDVEHLVPRLTQQLNEERAAGAYSDDLSGFELRTPSAEQAAGARVRFRPELGFSSKPVIGVPITLVKRVLLRLQLFVFDDLARQADEAIEQVENRLEVEIATRERLESEFQRRIRELEDKIRVLENSAGPASQRRAR